MSMQEGETMSMSILAAMRRAPALRLRFARAMLLAWCVGSLALARAEIAADASEGPMPAPTEPSASEAHVPEAVGPNHHKKLSPLDRRVALLAKELDLSAAQQRQVKKVLQGQRDEVSRVWSDASMPAALRVSTTQAIGDRTADQIRDVLTDGQRTRYLQAHTRETRVGAPGADVESWMKRASQK